MASSRASTTAGRKRAAKRATAAKPAQRKRTGGAHKPRPKAAAKKATPKSKPKAPKPKPKSRKPKAAAAAPASLASRGLKVALVAGGLALVLAAAYLFWFRNSSLVAVEQVKVEGIEGPEAAQVTKVLTESAKTMTTLNVDEGELAAAISQFPTAVAVQTTTDFPHGMTIEVTDRPPVILASDGGPPVPVAGDGTLLHGVSGTEGVPALQVDSLPAKGKLEGEPLALAQVAGAAPGPLLPLVDGLTVEGGDGIEVTLKGGIPVKFGDPDELQAKWTAVAAILADPQVKTLTHLDVRVPERPSIGGAGRPQAAPEG